MKFVILKQVGAFRRRCESAQGRCVVSRAILQSDEVDRKAMKRPNEEIGGDFLALADAASM